METLLFPHLLVNWAICTPVTTNISSKVWITPVLSASQTPLHLQDHREWEELAETAICLTLYAVTNSHTDGTVAQEPAIRPFFHQVSWRASLALGFSVACTIHSLDFCKAY